MNFPINRDFLKNGNWGLKLISLLIAVIVYYAIKTESARGGFAHSTSNDGSILQSR